MRAVAEMDACMQGKHAYGRPNAACRLQGEVDAAHGAGRGPMHVLCTALMALLVLVLCVRTHAGRHERTTRILILEGKRNGSLIVFPK
jgi:hypothetical protein